MIRRMARDQAQAYLRKRFQSSVTFSDFHLSFYPHIHVVIDDLVLRHMGRTDIPPLVEVREVSLDVTFSSIVRLKPIIPNVWLAGLQINTPPRIPGGPPLIHGTDQDLAQKYPMLIGQIHADDASLSILRYNSDKPPNQFAIHHLVIYNFNFDHPAGFHAELTNPKPRGEIDCDGSFGPWEAEEPSQTPVYAKYTFLHADLGTIKGIRGILSSTGRFGGPLDYLDVEGATDTPDFALRTSGHSMALHTDFTAVVDGTNGNTTLKNVTAKFLHTTLVTHGEVVDMNKKVKGRTIDLDAVSNDARIEDLLLLAVKTDQPIMTGSAKLKAKILIPEDENEDVLERMLIDGTFGVGEAHFTNPSVQGKIDSLSRRGQGEPNNLDISDSLSDLKGQFKMDSAAVNFSDLTFSVEGASVALAGAYNIDSGQMDFRGKLRLQAKLSQTTTGWKSIVLKPFDHFFKDKNGGTEIPIKITGTRDHPSFGLDFHDKANTK